MTQQVLSAGLTSTYQDVPATNDVYPAAPLYLHARHHRDAPSDERLPAHVNVMRPKERNYITFVK
jgi:hypothetical protein